LLSSLLKKKKRNIQDVFSQQISDGILSL